MKAVIPGLGIYSKERTRDVGRDAATGTFLAALFIIGNSWKQPEWLKTEAWLNEEKYVRKGNTLQP